MSVSSHTLTHTHTLFTATLHKSSFQKLEQGVALNKGASVLTREVQMKGLGYESTKKSLKAIRQWNGKEMIKRTEQLMALYESRAACVERSRARLRGHSAGHSCGRSRVLDHFVSR